MLKDFWRIFRLRLNTFGVFLAYAETKLHFHQCLTSFKWHRKNNSQLLFLIDALITVNSSQCKRKTAKIILNLVISRLIIDQRKKSFSSSLSIRDRPDEAKKLSHAVSL